ncbi:hypothetical protein PQX77_019512 [Marasmius sp. AFHP31]|nr:hypothetical protein PQX77_019512 [Marasmius sp. AFHP31]
MLVGLGRCVEEQLFTTKPKGIVDHHSWMQRPLSKQHLDYASHDVYLISQLLATFEKRGLINDNDIVFQIDHHSWMQRPLSKQHLDYASHDVYLISQLLATFEKRGLINDNDIVFQSDRYISIWNDKQPRKDDSYRSNPFFPLEILDHRDDIKDGSARCDGCKRNLSAASFPSVGLDVSGTYCHVCDLIPKWKENQRYHDKVRGRK